MHLFTLHSVYVFLEYALGKIDEVRMYNRAVSDIEAFALFQNPGAHFVTFVPTSRSHFAWTTLWFPFMLFCLTLVLFFSFLSFFHAFWYCCSFYRPFQFVLHWNEWGYFCDDSISRRRLSPCCFPFSLWVPLALFSNFHFRFFSYETQTSRLLFFRTARASMRILALCLIFSFVVVAVFSFCGFYVLVPERCSFFSSPLSFFCIFSCRVFLSVRPLVSGFLGLYIDILLFVVLVLLSHHSDCDSGCASCFDSASSGCLTCSRFYPWKYQNNRTLIAPASNVTVVSYIEYWTVTQTPLNMKATADGGFIFTTISGSNWIQNLVKLIHDGSIAWAKTFSSCCGQGWFTFSQFAASCFVFWLMLAWKLLVSFHSALHCFELVSVWLFLLRS